MATFLNSEYKLEHDLKGCWDYLGIHSIFKYERKMIKNPLSFFQLLLRKSVKAFLVKMKPPLIYCGKIVEHTRDKRVIIILLNQFIVKKWSIARETGANAWNSSSIENMRINSARIGKFDFPRKSGYSARINPTAKTCITNSGFVKPRFRASHKRSYYCYIVWYTYISEMTMRYKLSVTFLPRNEPVPAEFSFLFLNDERISKDRNMTNS